jgi:addiction module HigA family antidote
MKGLVPAPPGKVLRDYLGDIDVTTAARRVHVSRTTLSRILNGAAGITAGMSLRLSDALGTCASFWCDLQAGYDMWRASRKKRPKIERFEAAAQGLRVQRYAEVLKARPAAPGEKDGAPDRPPSGDTPKSGF